MQHDEAAVQGKLFQKEELADVNGKKYPIMILPSGLFVIQGVPEPLPSPGPRIPIRTIKPGKKLRAILTKRA